MEEVGEPNPELERILEAEREARATVEAARAEAARIAQAGEIPGAKPILTAWPESAPRWAQRSHPARATASRWSFLNFSPIGSARFSSSAG
jgi:hypothetical protein